MKIVELNRNNSILNQYLAVIQTKILSQLDFLLY